MQDWLRPGEARGLGVVGGSRARCLSVLGIPFSIGRDPPSSLMCHSGLLSPMYPWSVPSTQFWRSCFCSPRLCWLVEHGMENVQPCLQAPAWRGLLSIWRLRVRFTEQQRAACRCWEGEGSAWVGEGEVVGERGSTEPQGLAVYREGVPFLLRSPPSEWEEPCFLTP